MSMSYIEQHKLRQYTILMSISTKNFTRYAIAKYRKIFEKTETKTGHFSSVAIQSNPR